MTKRLFHCWDFLFIFVAAIATRLWNIHLPPNVVFDESYFGLYAAKYLSGTYFWDIHPPLGKLFFAFAGWVGGLKQGFDFQHMTMYPDNSYIPMRLLTACFGVLLVLLVYGFVKWLTSSRSVAFFASFLLVFDNALLVQSRFILLDMVLVFFIFATLVCFLIWRRTLEFSRKWYLLVFLTGFLGGAAMSIKWTGLAALGIVWIAILLGSRNDTLWGKRMNVMVAAFVILPLVVYISAFAIHFSLLKTVCTSNCGHALEGFERANTSLPEGTIISQIIEENKRMFVANLLTTSEEISYFAESQWFTWPVMLKPFPYLGFTINSKVFSIYFLGNPVVWLLGLLGIFGYLFIFLKHAFRKLNTKLPAYLSEFNVLMAGYGLYMISFAMVKRATIIYHYLFPLIISLVVFACVFDYFLRILVKRKLYVRLIFASVFVFVFAIFVFFAPLSYGLPLTQEELNLRLWLPTWNYE